MDEKYEARQVRWPASCPLHTNIHVRHTQLRGAARHRRQRFFRNKINIGCYLLTLQKMKIYSIIRSIKAEKNASNQQKGLQTSPLLIITAISAAVAAA